MLGLRPRRWLRPILRSVARGSDGTAWIASVGGGPGFEFDHLDRVAGFGTAPRILLDAQRPMLERAARRAERGRRADRRLLLGDAATLPFRDGSVGLLLSLGVLCCLTDDGADRAVAEAWRVVRPGGRVVLAVPRWRGAEDDQRHVLQGFVRIGGPRAGRSLFSKPS
ncbi:MAG: methyltransferase domain-containing protein [Thermoplasmata archaeon]|nr:methyltransferase domain-containing protein [Thermoplasmata archaeon]MCI4356923.1 methyltransferase domain-containing protein [Thermoplasmata archaeon]